MHRILCLLSLLITLSATGVYAQEICNNGIDDDKDGFIDCFDGKCASSALCDGSYIGNDANCEVKPTAFPTFSLATESASDNGTTTNFGRVVVGDLDRDGLPEMVTTNKEPKKIYILNGENTAGVNTVQKEITVSYKPMWEDILIANLDNDNCAEIFILGNDKAVHIYDCNLNELRSISLPGSDPGSMGLADFNGDGQIELYARNAIYNAHTGATIVAPGGSWSTTNGGPVAVDILNDVTKQAHTTSDAVKDDNLELVCGGVIYSVNIAGGTITAEKTLTNYFQRTGNDATSIADYNLDGSLDVIAVGSTVKDPGGRSGWKTVNTTIFFWDVKNNVLKTYSDPQSGSFTIQGCPASTDTYYVSGWWQGAGRVNIADIDGDGQLNAVYVSGKYLYALKEDFTQLWRIVVNEETSGYTGCTLFDFNGDGQSEVVYRDEKFVYIINGMDGTFYPGATKPCVSRTNKEYPIVADVDGDGTTELCVTCATDNDITRDQFCDTDYAQNSQVRVFRSGGEPWVPARRVWNQHGYFNVNVNDNLTIPKIQQKHHLVFSSNVCTPGANRPLNSFLNQSPFLNSQGCPQYAAPDISYVPNSFSIQPPTCPDLDFKVTFQITNKGDLAVNGNIPVTFYNGNPLAAGATKLNTVQIPVTNFGTGAIQTAADITVHGPGSSFTLYVALNDAGTSIVPITLPNTTILECNYDNVFSAQVKPNTVDITAVKVQDNQKCSGSATNTGAVKAFIKVGATENTTDYRFYWSIGTTAKPVASADFIGAIWSQRPAGTYTVYAIHKTAGCSSDTAQVVISDNIIPVNADIRLVHAYDHCSPDNGALRVIVNDTDGDGQGQEPNDFKYTWYPGNDIFTSSPLGYNDTITALKPITYTVLVEHKLSGCQTIKSFTIPDQTVIPTVSATAVDITCSGPGSGSTSANVGGATTGYTFNWYRGGSAQPAVDFTGPVFPNLNPGNYTVVAINNATGCVSSPVTVKVGKASNPVVTATAVTAQTSCDATLPNGSASANVGGATTGYTFEWFKGQNTLEANKVFTGSDPTGLTNSVYTVKATDNTTGCSGTEKITIDFAVVTPQLALTSKADPTSCSAPNGSITIGVTPAPASAYTFSWYTGNAVKATADFTDTDQTLSGLSPGTYTVKAVNSTLHCMTQPITVTLDDITPEAIFNLTDIVHPNTCNEEDGILTVAVSAPGNILGFTFEWRKGQEPYPAPAITTVTQAGNVSTASSLSSGLYTLIATDKDNGCTSTHTFNLPFEDAQEVSLITKTNILNCIPNNDGAMTINLAMTDGYDISDYTVYVYNGKNDLVDPALATITVPGTDGILQGDGTVNYTVSSLTAGFYTVVANTTNPAKSTFNCRSVPYTEPIEQKFELPVFVADAAMNNTNCDGIAGSGQLSVTMTNPTTNPADYTFDWFEGADSAAPLLGTGTSGNKTGVNGEVAKNLVGGEYTVVVTKTSATSAGCTSTATYRIFDNLPVISLATADLSKSDINRCDMPTNGSVTVNFVEENGVQQSPGDYDFEWYSNGPTGPQLITGATTNTLVSQPAGRYYVLPINRTNNCSAGGLVEIDILDNTMNTVSVDLVSFNLPTLCLKPANEIGALQVTANGTSTTGYTYNWYAGPDISSPALATANVSGASGEIAQDLVAGFYTIEAVNNTTQCKVTDTYELPVDRRPITLATSEEPLTVCFTSPLDGGVFATVTSGNKNDYTYLWYNETVKATPDFTSDANTPVSNLTPGNYIVVVVDNLDATCFASDTIRVHDNRKPPVVTAQALSPLTICDPARPDGVASASVDGDYISYTYDWFASEIPAGTPFYSGVQPSQLSSGVYSVIGTSLITGCSDTTQVTIGINQMAIPLPQIDILSLVTSCVEPNGALAANVNGNTSDYIFDWYNGSQLKATADFTGENYYDLAKGPYSVTATSRATGCISPLVTQDLGEDHLYPEFNWTTVAALCARDASEQPNGLAAVFVTNNADIGSIEWQTNGGTVTGPILSGVNAGTYSVTVTSVLGCATTKEIEIKTEIHPYNGISRSKNNQNDLFFINCIESFPSNIVKIFNRAGTLVYEAVGYDNSGIFFDGKSNKGINLMGNNLPDGTYFYIIDKRDGSKPLAGFLELTN